jgi:hypothetical protein
VAADQGAAHLRLPRRQFNGNGHGAGKPAGPAMPWRLLNKPYRKEDLVTAIGEVLGG